MTESAPSAKLRRTPLFERHLAHGGRMVDFAGWEMPVQYRPGIIEEHLTTRKGAGLFDVSHMGRFLVRGADAVPFLQHVLSNNACALDVGEAQYTIVPTETGGAVDDAYLYRFFADQYLLVVNASNREKDWAHFQQFIAAFNQVELTDHTEDIVMLAVQGPSAREAVVGLLEAGELPEPMRNKLSVVRMAGAEVWLSRTGYTGEPMCFELFAPREHGPALWDAFVAAGVVPVGLGARDTLRLEAGLPLYGHELGTDPSGQEIPIFAMPLAKFAVSLSPLKGDFVGRAALQRQQEAYRRIVFRDYSLAHDLPRIIQPIALTDRGVARSGAKVTRSDRHVGWITSGTMVPRWKDEGNGLAQRFTDKRDLRPLALALLDADIVEGDRVSIDIRGKQAEGVVVEWHLRSDAPPFARPIPLGRTCPVKPLPVHEDSARALLHAAADNTTWRQQRCINLIPSEMTTSPAVRLLSVMDPCFRYAEHRELEAFCRADVFYYQGTDFIDEVERLLTAELRKYFGCSEVETRVISGQMANAAVFSAMVDYLNRADPKSEPRRLRMVMNHHIVKGGHLSAQPMGALRDFVSRDPKTDMAAVENFPMLPGNPFKTDVEKTKQLILEQQPELIIFGRSMVLHKEPVQEIRRFLDEHSLSPVVMYDMAHVLGLIGPSFQDPFREGADVVTGSTHKTFFGTQRGVIACRFTESEERYDLWEAIRRRTFPGSVSNHHLGTLLGLLLATYEMNHFKDEYQPAVVANAKAFARALHEAGLSVAGDPTIDFTETHQVILRVGYGHGPAIARRLEDNDIICNYQAAPDEEGFSAAGALRLGVSEMTRFGFGAAEFRELAALMRAVILDGADVRPRVNALRADYRTLRYCFTEAQYREELARLRALL